MTHLANTILLLTTILALYDRALASEFRAEQRFPRLLITADATKFSDNQVPIRWEARAPEDGLLGGAGLGSLKVRGSSSSPNPKRPYKLEIQDAAGNDRKVSLLEMPRESDWILYPSFTDKTFIRDVLAYDLWRAMGYYAPRWRYVELYITTNSIAATNGRASGIEHPFILSNSVPSASSVANSNFASISVFSGQQIPDYQGIYVLLEKIKRGKHRVNIEKLPRGSSLSESSNNPTIHSSSLTASASSAASCSNDILSGGYIFKKDRLNRGEKGFISSAGMNFAYEEPKERDITPAQQQWLTNHINEFEAVLFGENFLDPENGYAKYIDVDSFIDYHWMVEMSRNIDAFFVSWFFHKDRGGKIKAGPIWDWDFGFGNTAVSWKTNSWVADSSKKHGNHYRWYDRLFQDPDFLQLYIDRWSELRTNLFATSNILARIDALAAQIEPHAERNYQRWPYLDQKVSGTYFVGKTYRSHVDYLKHWIEGRLAWIDSQDFPKPVFTVSHPLLSTSFRRVGGSGWIERR